MNKLIKPRKFYEFERSLDYSKLPELNSPQVGDINIDSWERYKEMSSKHPVTLQEYVHPTRFMMTSNIRKLESKLQGDWYYIITELFGNYITKVKPGRTHFKSNLNGQEVDKDYRQIAHIKCGKSKHDAKGIRVSTCMYNSGNEIQIPISEVDHFENSEYYFFEKNGLFLTFDTQKFLSLNNTQKWLCMGEPTEKSEKRFRNYSFSTLLLLKFGCIDNFGYCDGKTILKNRLIEQSSLKFNAQNKPKVIYGGFRNHWMRGCLTTFKADKYMAIYVGINKETKEVIKSQTISGLTEHFTNKNGKPMTRQAYNAQAKINTKNYIDNIIPQKLSLSYVEAKPYFIISTVGIKLSEEKLWNYIESIRESINIREMATELNIFLEEKSIEKNKKITKSSMSIDDYFEFISKTKCGGLSLNDLFLEKLEEYKESDIYELKSVKEHNYYKSEIAYYANKKRGFITRREVFQMKIDILLEDNYTGYDYYKFYKDIKGEAIKKDPIIYNYNLSKTLDKNKFFSYLKTNRDARGSP